MTIHRLPDIPVKPYPSIPDVWEVWCHCGWGATADSPEAAVIAAAHHLEPPSEATVRLRLGGPEPFHNAILGDGMVPERPPTP